MALLTNPSPVTEDPGFDQIRTLTEEGVIENRIVPAENPTIPTVDVTGDQEVVVAPVSEAVVTPVLPTAATTELGADWRLRISLAPDTTYLYNAMEPGILEPLRATDGVIFPYTPSVRIMHQASYKSEQITHSNFQTHFYNGSNVGEIQVSGTFTAQDVFEAQYVLAMMQFFKSASKMFYGQDQERGAPPPVLFMSGYGNQLMDKMPVLIRQFEYELPKDVDYIRTRPGTRYVRTDSTAFQEIARRETLTGSGVNNTLKKLSKISDAASRLKSIFLEKGGTKEKQGGEGSSNSTTSSSAPEYAYVPTKIDVNLVLIPLHSRDQMSKSFSLKDYASGKLNKGFW